MRPQLIRASLGSAFDMLPDLASQLDQAGFAILPSGLDPATLDGVARAVEAIPSTRHGAGARNLLDVVAVRRVALSQEIFSLVGQLLGSGCFAVRALWFDKTSDANWKVSWHQDVAIAVQERREVPGFGPWSMKAGVVHVQPPVAVLERMLAVRLHIDDCDLSNGPLRVVAGSHRAGRIAESDIASWRASKGEAVCVVARGDVVVMRPLLLHASSPAAVPAHRRVLHLEFSSAELPDGLQWYERYAPDRAA